MDKYKILHQAERLQELCKLQAEVIANIQRILNIPENGHPVDPYSGMKNEEVLHELNERNK